MRTLQEVRQAVRGLSPVERMQLLDWMAAELRTDSLVAEPRPAYGAAAPERRRFTFEEYLEIERSSPLRHEYVGGEIFAMGQPRQAHAIVAMNLATALHAHLSGRPCRTYAGGRRLHFKCRGDDIAYYPDVWVGCGGTRNLQGEFDDEPRLVIEVLSAATERIDRREKAINCREIGSLEEFALVAPKPVSIVLYRRSENWSPMVLDSAERPLELRSVGLALSVDRVYAGLP